MGSQHLMSDVGRTLMRAMPGKPWGPGQRPGR